MDKEYTDAYEALTEIDAILKDFSKNYPDLKKKKILKINNKNKAFKVLRSVERILKNYNEANAEQKLKDIICMFGKEMTK